MKKDIVAVLIAQEHLPFIREWCIHHLNQGWDTIHLYDNTGSIGSLRENSIFSSGKYQKEKISKCGAPYPENTRYLSDEDASKLLKRKVGGLNVIVHEWKPKVDGNILHFQVEAYVDYILKYKSETSWAAFIDCDEYLQSSTGEWDILLKTAEDNNVSRILLSGVIYDRRVDENGFIRDLNSLKCHGSQYQGIKNLMKLEDVLCADIHWGWNVGNKNRLAPDIHQFYFKHYNGLDFSLKNKIEMNYSDDRFGIRVYE